MGVLVDPVQQIKDNSLMDKTLILVCVNRFVHRITPSQKVLVLYALILIALRGGIDPSHFTLVSSAYMLTASIVIYVQGQKWGTGAAPGHSIILPLVAAWLIAFLQCFCATVFISAIEEVWAWAVYLLCFITAASSRKLLHPNRIVLVFAALLGLLCAHVFLEAFSGVQLFGMIRPPHYLYRYGSVYYNPNHLANLIVILSPFLLTGMSMPSHGRWRFAAYGLPLGMGFITMIFTQSRSGMIALGCALAIWFGFIRPRKLVWLRFAVVLIVCATAAWYLLGEASRRHFAHRMETWTRDDRLTQLWPTTIDMIRAKPWWGWGPGSYVWVYPSYDRHLPATLLKRTHAHNDFLELISQSGLVGGIAICGLVLVAWRRGFRATTRRGRSLFAAGAASAGGMLAQSVFDFTMYVPANVVVLAVLLGCSCRGLRPGGNLAASKNDGKPAVPALGILLVFFAMGGIVLWANNSIMESALRRNPSVERHSGGLKHSWISLNPCRDWRGPWIQSMALSVNSGSLGVARPAATTDCDAAESLLNRTLRLNPCWIPAYHSLAETRFACGKTEEAFAAIDQGLARFPGDFGLWFQKALAERERNRTEEAIASYRQALVMSFSKQMSEVIRRDLAALGAPVMEEEEP
ncbi:MAG: hypothetical protein EOM72_04080 [Opitutae bacterium]|nr:hypothetical protein [Opitutae bacterium]